MQGQVGWHAGRDAGAERWAWVSAITVLRPAPPPPAGGAAAQVGIVWNYFWFEPKRYRWLTPCYLPWIRWGGAGAARRAAPAVPLRGIRAASAAAELPALLRRWPS